MAIPLTSSPAVAACGPGNRWVGTCAAGTDKFNVTATIGIGGSLPVNLQLSGTVTISRGTPSGSVIPIEITSMNLSGSVLGSAVTMQAGDAIGNRSSDGPLYSPGTITENPSNPALATLSANVFFEVSTLGQLLHNAGPQGVSGATPLQIQSSIDRVPPTLNISGTLATPIPLLNAQNQPSGFTIASIAISGGPVATTLSVVSGDNQIGNVGQTLPDPLVLSVTDSFGQSMSGVSVSFILSSGGGSLSAAKAITNAQGKASTMLTLGPTPGTNTVTASTGNLSPVIFNATATAPQPAAIASISGDNQTGTVGQPLASPFVVVVTATNNNPVSGVSVVFQVVSGGGKLTGGVSQLTATTNAQGRATTILTLGSAAGTNTVTATSGTLAGSPVTFAATGIAATAGPPAKISAVSGSNQIGLPGLPLVQPFVVQVTDANNIPVSGVVIAFAVTSGDGSLSVAQFMTDASGQASAVLTLGPTAGPNTVTATLANVTGSPVTFTATGSLSPDSSLATILVMVSGNDQSGFVGEPLTEPFVVQATDDFGFPVSGAPVTFGVTRGGGEFTTGVQQVTVTTDLQGQASASLILGSTGLNFVAAVSGTLSGSPIVFTATGTPIVPGSATKISAGGGNNQIGTVKQPLAAPFVVQVTDARGLGVSGVPVQFTITAGAGTISASETTTDSQGQASTVLTLGSNAGSNIVIATSTDLVGSPVSFTAAAFLSPAISSAKMFLASGNTQTGIVKRTLPQPFVVKVADSQNAAIAGVPVAFSVVDGGGSLSASVVATDAQGQASVHLTLGPNPGTNTVSAAVGTLTGSPIVFSAIALNATTPILPPNSVVNGASFRPASQPNAAVAPGSIVTIFGINLAGGTQSPPFVPLPTTLNHTSVTFNGIMAPLILVSDGQITAQVPFETPIGPVDVQVKRGSDSSDTEPVMIAPVSPGIFAVNQQGSGQGSVLISNTPVFAAVSGTISGQQARPARRGEFISIYCSGLGDVTNRPPNGAPSFGAPASVTLATVTAKIGGITVPAAFSGLTTYVGLYQVDVQVPPEAPVGDAVDVVLDVAGVSSNHVSIAVQF
ncbi:MAG: hypothetical protein HYX72_08045 [Acidobacteria bacterium]|nr:hypothetical protein [Acidobacteriota bacterium]